MGFIKWFFGKGDDDESIEDEILPEHVKAVKRMANGEANYHDLKTLEELKAAHQEAIENETAEKRPAIKIDQEFHADREQVESPLIKNGKHEKKDDPQVMELQGPFGMRGRIGGQEDKETERPPLEKPLIKQDEITGHLPSSQRNLEREARLQERQRIRTGQRYRITPPRSRLPHH